MDHQLFEDGKYRPGEAGVWLTVQIKYSMHRAERKAEEFFSYAKVMKSNVSFHSKNSKENDKQGRFFIDMKLIWQQ